MRSLLERLWSDWTGRLFLTNLANQIEAGVIDPVELRPFFDAGRARPSTFNDLKSLLGDVFPAGTSTHNTPLHFCASVGPFSNLDRIFIRVTSFDVILSCVKFPDKDGIRDSLREGMIPSRTPAQEIERQEYVADAVTRCRDPNFDEAKLDEWGLPAELLPLCLRIADLRANGPAMKNPSREPVFLAPFIEGSFNESLLLGAPPPPAAADYVRDRLGLDYLSSRYTPRGGSEVHVMLGFIMFRERQLTATLPLRPTPLDNASRYRFRGTFGALGGARSPTGRTADLANVNVSSDPVGASEIVVANETLDPTDRQVILGYLGEVTDPRRDASRPGLPANPSDLRFLELCRGAWGRDEILDKIESAQV